MANTNPGYYGTGNWKIFQQSPDSQEEAKHRLLECKKCFKKIGYYKPSWLHPNSVLCEKCYKIKQVKQ